MILYREKTQISLGINITDTGKREKMLHNFGTHVHNYNILFLLFSKRYVLLFCFPRVGISGTTAKSRQRKFVPSSDPGPFALVATSRKGQTKVGTLACFDLL